MGGTAGAPRHSSPSCRTATLAATLIAAIATQAPQLAAADTAPPPPPPLTRPANCPAATDPSAFTSTQALYKDDSYMGSLGPRPTGSPAQETFLNWIQGEMGSLPGMSLGQQTFAFTRQAETGASLALQDGTPMEISSIVPDSQPTAPTTKPLITVPASTALSTVDVRGKIVIRDFPPSSIPNAVFTALSWWTWDPDTTLTKTIGDSYVREYLSAQRETDLTAAANGGAAGLIFVHELPGDQMKGTYAPYDGLYWGVPSVYVGADEGVRLERAAAQGQSATLSLSADRGPATTRMLIDTLPGVSSERLIVSSHTDGMNAVWDNGPVAMVALARYYASLPQACRPRTLQFVFTTGHLFQAMGGPTTHDGTARIEAQQLDKDYADGTVAAVMTVEHMGAKGYAAVPRTDGGPGYTLQPTGNQEANAFFFGESPAISQAVLSTVVRDGLTQTIALRGADLPGEHIPMHYSFGGEGGPYHQRLIPTIAFVTGPWTLFGTAFRTDQILDKDLLHKQTLVFSDILHAIETVPRQVLAGGYIPERTARSVICATSLSSLGLANGQDEPLPPLGGADWLSGSDPQLTQTIGKLESVH